MSDNMPKDLCEQKITAYLDIPTEVWTDIFMLLPRRTLVLRVQPVNKVFKAICDKNVKSIHIIGYIHDDRIKEVVAQHKLEALAGNNCLLSGHFRMTNVQIDYNSGNEAKLAVIRNSLDLFHRCQLIILPQTYVSRSLGELAEHCLAYLTALEPTRPSCITMRLEMESDVSKPFIESHLSDLLHHPTTLNCPRLALSGYFGSCGASRQAIAILDWLHHRVDDVDMVEEHGEEVRSMIFFFFSYNKQSSPFTEWLIEQCVQNFKQSKVPEDRRSFVLAFEHYYGNELDNFEHKNTATGEVLLLERVLDDGQPSACHRLLRCSASRVANNGKEQLFAKMFKYSLSFNLKRAGDDVAEVKIL